jgi:hypothetical protein
MFINSTRFGLFRSFCINVNVNRSKRGPIKSRKRQFTKESVDDFNYLSEKNHGKGVFKFRYKCQF